MYIYAVCDIVFDLKLKYFSYDIYQLWHFSLLALDHQHFAGNIDFSFITYFEIIFYFGGYLIECQHLHLHIIDTTSFQ